MMILRVGTKINGIMSVGLRTIGIPNTIGSLIPKIPGISASFPNSVTRLDLQKANIAIINEIVDPQPPNVAKRSWNC